MYKNTELRKLPVGILSGVSAILEINDDWKKVMSKIPRNPRSDYFEPKYNKEHIRQIEDHAKASSRKCTDVMFEEWGTSGRIRPTLGTLKDVVERAGIIRAARELADMVQEEVHVPETGVYAPVPITEMLKDSSGQLSLTTEYAADTRTNGHQQDFPNLDMSGIETDGGYFKDSRLIPFAYRDLEAITKKFSDKLIYMHDPAGGKLAGKIGSGGFAEVFVGYHARYEHIAVKKVRSKEIAEKMFKTEVTFLSQLRHKNVVPIIGFSRDGPALCIVCEYVDGGSLEMKLATKNILVEKQRINIMIGTAEGLRYLHGYENKGTESDSPSSENKFIHGDIKSANILLTKECVPKLCDFGLARAFDNTFTTKNIIGSTAYMAPETFNGTITQKSDIFSFGIVMLELLTGQKPLIRHKSGETINIKYHIEDNLENNELNSLLDPFIDKWTRGKDVYNLAKHCLMDERKNRPTSQEICNVLYRISEEVDKEHSTAQFKASSNIPYQLLDSLLLTKS